MGSQITKRADAGNLGVSHPAPFGIKPSAERAAMAVGAARASDFAKVAFGDLLLEKNMLVISPHEIARGEEQICFLNCFRHRFAFMSSDAQSEEHTSELQ